MLQPGVPKWGPPLYGDEETHDDGHGDDNIMMMMKVAAEDVAVGSARGEAVVTPEKERGIARRKISWGGW